MPRSKFDLSGLNYLSDLRAMIDRLTCFAETRQRSEELCAPLKNEDYVAQPAFFASPPKWHLAHTTWFFEAFILSEYQEGYERFHPVFDYLFNSYYNNIGEHSLRKHRGNMTRPTVEEVYAYRHYVDQKMKLLILNNDSAELYNIVTIGLNHEQQHQELLLMDVKYGLGHNPLFPIYKTNNELVNSKNTEKGLISIPEAVYKIGYEGDGFCYDNELGRHKVYIQEFEIDKALVTNGQFIEFIEAGGYDNFNLWLDEGWEWLKNNQITSPLYWHRTDDEWFQFTLAGLKKINTDEVLCHVSFYEASAFAEWKGLRLPTEFEWEVASEQLAWGQRWEWTNSAYLPYPQFNKAAGAIGEYNGKFMINQMILRGGSVATPNGHTRKTYRNFFQPDSRWMFSGIRLAN